MALIPFEDSEFQFGQAGLAGANAPSGQMAEFESRLAALELLTPPTVINDLSDVDTATNPPSVGDLWTWDGTNWVPYTWPGITYTFGVPFTMDGGGSTITTGVKYTGIEIPFACTITGWTAVATSNASGANFVATVSKATYSASPTYTAISGTEKPTIAIGASKGQDLTLSTWTTAVTAGDLLQISVDAAGALTYATVTLRIQRTI